jgi:hypothetical protein
MRPSVVDLEFDIVPPRSDTQLLVKPVATICPS